MDKEKLYELLDIDEPADFEYFENLAALLECDEYIDFEQICELIEGVDKDNLALLIDNYFEELSDFIPGESEEFFLLMDKIKLSLMGLARSAGDEERVLVNLAEELNRFRVWYSAESEVYCRLLSETREETQTLRDALALARLEKIEGDKYAYDFSPCLEYELDDYIMSFADVIAAEYEETEDDAE